MSVRGSSGQNSMISGGLGRAQLVAPRPAAGRRVDRRPPGRSPPRATRRWPHSSSGRPDHGGVDDPVAGDEHVLDLGRGDVLPAPDDGVVGPTLDEQVAVLVEAAPVAGGEPAVVRRAGCRRRTPRRSARPGRTASPSWPAGTGRPRRRGPRPRCRARAGRPTPGGRGPPGSVERRRPPGDRRVRAGRWSSWSRSARRR